ncbi:hypothetical protein Agub_g5416 [Astrephomene gubernaculifera]|uniref:Uncharacterized protein n=1 Tax=Astrephomene gubernaculifera TaxID=47775 RepID=A0AAD3HKS0_9CHLO|nr:hypothetical protein Agub_g5416 [Astrephomene gubernaculifera]
MSVESRAKTRSKPNTVHYAAETGDIKLLQHFVKEGMALGNPESVTLQQREDVLGMMPLHVACENGEHEVVEFLVKKRVDVDAGDNFKVTALHLAAIENHTDIVDVLLKARADPKPVDVEGDMPIHWAATKGHSQVIEQLVRKGSPVDPHNKKGWTPLHRAAYNGRKDAVLTLAKLGAAINAVTCDGNTPLHLACFMNQLSTLEKLCELGASQRPVNRNGMRAADLCITDAAREILKSLQSHDDAGAGTLAATPAAGQLTANGAGSRLAKDGAASSPSTGGKPVIPSLAALQISSKKSSPDGFPSPASSPGPSSFSVQRPAGPAAGVEAASTADVSFIKSALTEAGTNPYTGMSGAGAAAAAAAAAAAINAAASLAGRPPSCNGSSYASSDTAAVSTSAPFSMTSDPQARNSSSSSLHEPAPLAEPSGLAAHPTPLAGSLRPLRAPSASTVSVGAAGGGGAVGPARPPSTGRVGTTTTGSSVVGELSSSTSASWVLGGLANVAGGGLLSPQLLGEDVQERIKEENRRGSSVSNDVLRPRSARPVSANKKFLARYNLDKLNLFAP